MNNSTVSATLRATTAAVEAPGLLLQANGMLLQGRDACLLGCASRDAPQDECDNYAEEAVGGHHGWPWNQVRDCEKKYVKPSVDLCSRIFREQFVVIGDQDRKTGTKTKQRLTCTQHTPPPPPLFV